MKTKIQSNNGVHTAKVIFDIPANVERGSNIEFIIKATLHAHEHLKQVPLIATSEGTDKDLPYIVIQSKRLDMLTGLVEHFENFIEKSFKGQIKLF